MTEGWGAAARERVNKAARSSNLNAHVARYFGFADKAGVNPVKDGHKKAVAVLADYLEHYLLYSTKGVRRPKKLERPEGTLVTICVAINAAFKGMNLPSPAEDPLIVRQVQEIIKSETLRAKADKGIIDFPKLLRFILAKEMGEEEKERTLLAVVLAAVRIARIRDLFCLDRRTVHFGNDFAVIYSLGEKADRNRQGNISVLMKCSDPRVCPVRLLHSYIQRTQKQVETFVSGRPEEDKEKPVPLFYYLRGRAQPYTQRTLQATLNSLFSAAGMERDEMGRKIKPGSIRISARMAAERAGHPEQLISAVGHWVTTSVQANHYTVYDVPDSWTDSILQPERIGHAS
jgi:hypothetical protein